MTAKKTFKCTVCESVEVVRIHSSEEDKLNCWLCGNPMIKIDITYKEQDNISKYEKVFYHGGC